MSASAQQHAGGKSAEPPAEDTGIILLPREKYESARTWCYRVLIHNITHLRLPPGASVGESELPTVMGVSRTPVREALMQLAQENFVNIVPQKGTYVSRINMSQVLELRYIRRCVESETARTAAIRITPEQVAEMNAHLEKQRQAADAHDFEAFIEADDGMHKALYRAAGKEGVWDFFNRTNLHHFRSRILGLRVSRTLTRLINEHETLISALQSHNVEKADEAVRKHLSDAAWNADSVQETYPDYIDLPN